MAMNGSTLFALAAKLTLDRSGFTQDIGAAKKEFQGLGSSMTSVMGGVKKMLAGLGIAFSVKKLLDVGLAFNNQMDTYRRNFGVLLGDVEKGAQMTERLRTMAAATPFALTDLADATQTLLSYQVSAENVEEVLHNLGDIALGDKQKLGTLASVFGQISMAGKLLTQDYKQLINVGFNPLTFIAKRTGESMEQLQDRMSKGGISAQEVTQAFHDATAEGGVFYQGMEQGSKTMTGLMSTLNDTWTQFVGNITEPVYDALTTHTIPAAIRALNKISAALFDTQEDSENLKKELFGVDENGNAVNPTSNLTTWYEELMKEWTDGLPETDDTVSKYASQFQQETDLIAGALKSRIEDTANPLSEEEKAQALAGLEEIEAMNGRVQELLTKRQNGTITQEEQAELQGFIDRLKTLQELATGSSADSANQTPIVRLMDKLGTYSETAIDKLADGIVNVIENWDRYKETIGLVAKALVGVKLAMVAGKLASGALNGSAVTLLATLGLVITSLHEIAKAGSNTLVVNKREEAKEHFENGETGKGVLKTAEAIATQVTLGNISMLQKGARALFGLTGNEALGEFGNAEPGQALIGSVAKGIDWLRNIATGGGNHNPTEIATAMHLLSSGNWSPTGRESLYYPDQLQNSGYTPMSSAEFARSLTTPVSETLSTAADEMASAVQAGAENANITVESEVTVNVNGDNLARAVARSKRSAGYSHGGQTAVVN